MQAQWPHGKSKLATTALTAWALVAMLAACAPAASPDADRSLTGTSWQLVRFEGGDGTMLTPADRSRYTIHFASDGMASMRIDCNRGGSTWSTGGSGTIRFGPLKTTRAMCPPGSLYDHIVKQWPFVRGYVIRGGNLFLSLMADGGIYEFEPVVGERLVAPIQGGSVGR